MKTREELAEFLQQLPLQPEQPLGIVMDNISYSLVSVPDSVMIAEGDGDFITFFKSEIYDTEKICSDAIFYYNQRELDKATQCIEQGLVLEKDKKDQDKDWRVYYLGGKIALATRLFSSAIGLFSFSLDIGCECPVQCYNHMATAFTLDRKPNEAYLCYMQAIKLEPNNLQTIYNLGGFYWDMGYFKDAAICYLDILEQNPNDFDTIEEIGNLLSEWRELNNHGTLGDYFLECCRTKNIPNNFFTKLQETKSIVELMKTEE